MSKPRLAAESIQLQAHLGRFKASLHCHDALASLSDHRLTEARVSSSHGAPVWHLQGETGMIFISEELCSAEKQGLHVAPLLRFVITDEIFCCWLLIFLNRVLLCSWLQTHTLPASGS
jgi:hypothetical protein